MAKKIKNNLSSALSLGLMSCVAYYLLLCDNVFHASVSSIIAWSHQLSMKFHLAVLALIPVYIAVIIFGAALLGIYLGAMLDRSINNIKSKNYQPLKSRL